MSVKKLFLPALLINKNKRMTFSSKLAELKDKGFFENLEISRGIEKESLRVKENSQLSQSNHPKELGSALTNQFITTDFSEALIELVTPTFSSIDEVYDFLLDLHIFTANAMESDEVLWSNSMPCFIGDESEIRIAEYGSSNIGKLKNIYRKGLRVRYGSIMQCVAGIHYNFSIDDNSLGLFTNNLNKETKSDIYLGLIRNFKRNLWFLLYFFGASPMFDKSFVSGRNHSIKSRNKSDLYDEYATSLRMSDVGYQSYHQKALNIKYNSLDSFIESLKKGIFEEYEVFKNLGLYDESNRRQQISSGILQIENELYDSIRPKRKGASETRPIELLSAKGIEYVEVRGIDLSPNTLTGISKSEMRLLDVFLIHCLVTKSEQVSQSEYDEMNNNYEIAIHSGSDLNQNLSFDGLESSIRNKILNISEELLMIAKELNSVDPEFERSVSDCLNMENKSRHLLDNILGSDDGFTENILQESINKMNSLRGAKLKNETLLESEKLNSIELHREIEAKKSIELNKYVKQYNDKVRG